jgi:hypothetical protein
MKKLNKNECLIPLEGMPVNEEPCYIVVDVSKADPAKVVTLQKGEVLVCAGSIANAEQRQAAYERYMKAVESGTTPPRADTKSSTPFYVKVDISEINKRTGLTHGEEAACTEIAKTLVEKFK